MQFFQRRFILIADDNRDLAISLALLLRLVGFEVAIVHNGPMKGHDLPGKSVLQGHKRV